MQRKRIEELSKVVNETDTLPALWLRIKEFNGHSVTDIALGAVTGMIVYLLVAFLL